MMSIGVFAAIFVGASIGIGFLAGAFQRSALAWAVLSFTISPILSAVLLLFELQWPGLIERDPNRTQSEAAKTTVGICFGLLVVAGMAATTAR